MKEITGNLWDYYGKPKTYLCITTNGFVKKDGTAVCGRGCAKEANIKHPDFAENLGWLLITEGNKFQWVLPYLYAFPVKYNWWEKADLKLIRKSALELKDCITKICEIHGGAIDIKFILPRPGCGNGGRTWEEVKPLLEDLPDNVFVITPA
jgi:hypothetical protein